MSRWFGSRGETDSPEPSVRLCPHFVHSQLSLLCRLHIVQPSALLMKGGKRERQGRSSPAIPIVAAASTLLVPPRPSITLQPCVGK
jgi:hypothetical protein